MTATAETAQNIDMAPNEISQIEKAYDQLKHQEVSSRLDQAGETSQKLQKEKALQKTLENNQEKRDEGFMDKVKGVFSWCYDAVKKAVDFLVVKPAKFAWEQMKKHPFLTAAIVLCLIGAWYYWPVLANGMSGAPQQTVKTMTETLSKTMSTGDGQRVLESSKEALNTFSKAAETGF